MSDRTYTPRVHATRAKPLVWLRGEIKTPPFSADARLEAGVLLRRLQGGDKLSMPVPRAMPSIGPRCHGREWRIVYRLDSDAMVIADVFAKTTRRTPHRVVAECRRRLNLYDEST